MAWFLISFNITDVSIWCNLSFDQAKQLFNNLQISDKQPLLITKKNDEIFCLNPTLSTSKSSTQKGKTHAPPMKQQNQDHVYTIMCIPRAKIYVG